MSQLASTTVRYYQPWVKETAAKYHLSEDHLQSLVGGFLDGVPFDALVKNGDLSFILDASGDCPSGAEELGQLGEQGKTVHLPRMICNPEICYLVGRIESAQLIRRTVFSQRNGRAKNMIRVRDQCW